MQQSAFTQRQQYDREDADLLKRVQRSDQRALTSLYDRYAAVLYPLSIRMTGSHEAAEELVLDVFAHVWEKAGSYTSYHGSVYAWLIAVCRMKGMEKVRAANQRRRGTEEGAPKQGGSDSEQSSAGSDSILVMKGVTEDVRNSLKSLSKLELRLLELSYYEGQSQSDLARMLRIPLGTIKAKMRRGIQKLRQVVSQEAK